MVWEDAPKLESYLDRKDIVDSKELVVLVFALDSATHRQACLRTDRQIHLQTRHEIHHPCLAEICIVSEWTYHKVVHVMINTLSNGRE